MKLEINDYTIDFSINGRLNTAYVQYDEIYNNVYLLYAGRIFRQKNKGDIIATAKDLLWRNVSGYIKIEKILKH